ncbi:MAG TPA: hypothetical protein VGJ13_05995 [Pseudonocardiaceae bacterium]
MTFDDQPAAIHLAADYAPVLNELPILDPIPVRWLHLTMQGIGSTDEVDRAEVTANGEQNNGAEHQTCQDVSGDRVAEEVAGHVGIAAVGVAAMS